MTFIEFCEAIGDGVLSVVPAAKYAEPKAHKGPAIVSYGGMKVAVTREETGWLAVFSRTDGGAAKAPMSGSAMNASTASNIAQHIAGFLT